MGFPLVPDGRGNFVEKRRVVEAMRELAVRAGIGERRITEHSMRVTGAQRMALAGVHEWRIQLFGRWGSQAVLAYIRETLLEGRREDLAAEVQDGDAVVVAQGRVEDPQDAAEG